jgi:hypothetical protein
METTTTTYRRKGRNSSVSFFCHGTRSDYSEHPAVIPLNDEKLRIKVALDKLSYLKAGWDGLDALPISVKAVSNVLQLLAVSDDKIWQNWVLEPNINGTLTLRSRSHTSAISLGADRFSFFVKNGRNVAGSDNVPFSAEAVIRIMQS